MTRLLRPAWLLLTPVAFSFLTWIVDWPAGWRTGFDEKEAITVPGVVLLIVFYGLAAFTATIGWSIGRRAAPNPRLAAGRDDRVYLILTAAAVLGVGYTYIGAELTNPGVLVASLQDSTFNDVRTLVPYAAGLPTFRYASAIAGGMALYHLFLRRSFKPVHVLNLVLLALSAALASRLSLVLAVFVFLVLSVTDRSRRGEAGRRLRPAPVLVTGVLAFLLLAGFNYIRNANFYEVNYGVTNPITMNVQEIITYADAPMQVSIGVASKGQDDLPAPASLLSGMQSLLSPSFTRSDGGDSSDPATGAASAKSWFRGLIPLETNLTTNSAIVEIYGEIGLYCIPFMALVAFLGGLVIGHAGRYRNSMIVVAAIVGYCFLEVWRTLLFNAGIMIFCVLAVVVSCAVSAPRTVRSDDDADDDAAATPRMVTA